ncbi:MAG: metalloregulator ArsR/SmtB family transcription factor [Acidobacteriota bacterium]|nr:metalloregulator ArsR/SmtB family transcription factor [Acidobacteriota bacterium]
MTEALVLADRFAALGHEARLRIVRLLLAAHPAGLVVGEIQDELEIPASTLSHHLDALRHQGLVLQEREGRFLRYRAGADALREVMTFLYAECCSRNSVIDMNEPAEACC